MEYVTSGKELLDVAIEWYEKNPGVSIPRNSKIGSTKIDSNLYFQNENFSIEPVGDSSASVSHVSANLMPFLAGVVLKFTPEKLSAIIHDHEIDRDQFSNLEFTNEWAKSFKAKEDPDLYISSARIWIEKSKAFACDPHLKSIMTQALGHPTEGQTLGIMHIADEYHWPATMISKHAEIVMSEFGNPFKSFNERFQGSVSLPRTIDELPNGSALDLLTRSGMLTEAVLRKQTSRFDMWEDIAFHSNYNSKPQVAVLEHLAKTEDKNLQALALRGLLSMSANASHHEIVAQSLYETLQIHFGGNEAFNPVFDSIILKLNLFVNSDYQRGLQAMSRHALLFDEILDSQETLLSRVANEIISRPGDNLGFYEICVFNKLSMCRLPEQVITFSPELLINKVMDSYSSFISPAKQKEYEKKKIDNEALKSIESMIHLLGKDRKFDYDQFTHRSDNDKVALIESGMEMRSFKGLSRQARGRLLENDLGM